MKHQKKAVWWIGIILFLLSSCATVETLSEKKGANKDSLIAFEEQSYDFGIAGPEQTVRHIFKFKNNSSEPLKITKLSPSCGCTVVMSTQDEIPPGGSGEIKATLETLKYEGKQEATIIVHFTGENNPKITLKIKGDIKKGIAVVPEGINLGSVKSGEAVSSYIRVLQLSEQVLILNKIEANERYFSVHSSRFVEENSRGIQIEISMKANVPPGIFSDVITLHTNADKHPRIDVPIIATIIQN